MGKIGLSQLVTQLSEDYLPSIAIPLRPRKSRLEDQLLFVLLSLSLCGQTLRLMQPVKEDGELRS